MMEAQVATVMRTASDLVRYTAAGVYDVHGNFDPQPRPVCVWSHSSRWSGDNGK